MAVLFHQHFGAVGGAFQLFHPLGVFGAAGFGLARFQIIFLAIDEHHHVGVLFDRAGFAKVGQNRPLVIAGVNATRQLRKRQHNLSLIVIDYLQLLRPAPGQRVENRVQELSEITRTLKQLAKELNVPVIALSQLSRQVENREDKRPQLADLRESGSIEQDADVVMFIYREEYYLRPKEPRPDDPKYIEWQQSLERAHNQAEVIVAKQRHGPTGVVKVFFEDQFTRVGNLDTTHDVGGSGG